MGSTVVPLSNIARISSATCRITRVCIGRSGIVDPSGVEERRVVSSIVTGHSSRQMLVRGGVVLRRVAFIAAGSWLGARRVAGLAIIRLLAIWVRHRCGGCVAVESVTLVIFDSRVATSKVRKCGEPHSTSRCAGRGQVKSCRRASGSGHPQVNECGGRRKRGGKVSQVKTAEPK